MKKIYTFIFLLVLIGLSVGLWLYFRKNQKEGKPAISAVSARSILVVEVNQPQVSLARLTKDTKYFSVFSEINSFSSFLEFCQSADSLMKANIQFGNAFSNSPVILSISGTTSNAIEVLLASSFSNPKYETEISSFLTGIFSKPGQVKESVFQETKIFEVNRTITSKTTFCAASNGVFLLSTTRKVIEDALTQLNSNKSILDDVAFAKAYKSAGKKADANLFINYKSGVACLGKVLSNVASENFSGLGDFASWSGIDLNFKSESVMMNGFTWCNSPNQYLGFWSGKPVEIALISNLPQNTAGFLFVGAEKFIETGKVIFKISQKVAASDSIANTFLGWIGDQMVLGILDNHDTLISENAILLVRSKDSALAANSLEKLFRESTATGLKELNETYNGYTLKSLNNTDIFKKFFGNAFGLVKHNYYTNFGGFIAFANNSLTLKNYINYYQSEKTLINQPTYTKITEDLSKSTNLFVYARPTPIGNKFKQYLNSSSIVEFSPYLSAFNNFDGFALQFSSQTDGFYTSGFLNFGQTFQDSSVAKEGWTATLDTTVSYAPVIIENPATREVEIIVQDDAHKLYCITTLGRVKWKMDLKESAKGEIHLLRNFIDNKSALVAGTKNAIHALSLEGAYLPGYPINLDAKNTSGLSVLDYENKGDYRLIFACGNEKAFNLDKVGKAVKGWSLTKIEDDITHPFTYVKLANKDFLFALDASGRVRIYDRQGKKKLELKDKFEISLNNTLYGHWGKNAKQAGLYFSKPDGAVIWISPEGKIENIVLKPFTENHRFLAKDLDGDGNVEFIYLDLNELFVYSRKKELLGNYKWEEEIHFTPQLIKQNANKFLIGVVGGESRKLFLMDSDAKPIEPFPVAGSTPFATYFKGEKLQWVVSTDGKNILTILDQAGGE